MSVRKIESFLCEGSHQENHAFLCSEFAVLVDSIRRLSDVSETLTNNIGLIWDIQERVDGILVGTPD